MRLRNFQNLEENLNLVSIDIKLFLKYLNKHLRNDHTKITYNNWVGIINGMEKNILQVKVEN